MVSTTDTEMSASCPDNLGQPPVEGRRIEGRAVGYYEYFVGCASL